MCIYESIDISITDKTIITTHKIYIFTIIFHKILLRNICQIKMCIWKVKVWKYRTLYQDIIVEMSQFRRKIMISFCKFFIFSYSQYPTIKDLHIILPFTIYYLIEIMCSLLQNVNFATTTTNTERFVCNRQKIALNSVANLYVNSLQNNKQSIRWGERG